MKFVQLENSFINMNTHDSIECNGNVCPYHNRTNHHMREFRQIFSVVDGNIMCRICTHGIRHPDPDEPKVISGQYNDNHECDACCFTFANEEGYNGFND